MINISPTLILTIGIVAGLLFLSIFLISLMITMRNRRIIISRSATPSKSPGATSEDHSK